MSPETNQSEERFNAGLVELRRYLSDFDEAGLERAAGLFRAATRLSPSQPDYWVGLGYVLDMREEPEAALAAMRRAQELDTTDEEAEVYVLTLLAEAGDEAAALSGIEGLAARTDVDLKQLKQELAAAEMPIDALTILKNGFIYPRNFVRSRLEDLMDRAERSQGSSKKQVEADLEECREQLAELEREFDSARVPPDFRELVTWVLRLGVGDDPSRALLAETLSENEKDRFVRELRQLDVAVNAWLDSFSDKPLTPEAAAFMYTLLAAEEISL